MSLSNNLFFIHQDIRFILYCFLTYKRTRQENPTQKGNLFSARMYLYLYLLDTRARQIQ